jgi:putative hydrolase of the HAD superfamily
MDISGHSLVLLVLESSSWDRGKRLREDARQRYRGGVTGTVPTVPARVRAVLFDLDGVIRHWDRAPVRRIEAAHGLVPGALDAVALAPARLRPALMGTVTDAEWRAEVRREMVARFGAAAAEAVDEWNAVPGRVDAREVALVARVRARAAVALLTNATTRLELDLVDAGLDEVFPLVVCSSAVGAVKPEPAIYEHALARLGVDADGCGYVDDDAANVEAAAALGLHAVHFTGVADADARLTGLLQG